MTNFRFAIRVFIASIIIFSTIILFIHALNIYPEKDHYSKVIVFACSSITLLYFILKRDPSHIFDYLAIMLIYNPFLSPHLNLALWQIIDGIVILLNIVNVYIVFRYDEIKEIERIAKELDDYLKSIEQSLSAIGYHQATIYIHKKYPDSDITNDKIIWRLELIPNFEFIILPTYYEGKTNKGGISAKGLNEYKNIEVHCNFNLPKQVKYTVIEQKHSKLDFSASCLQLKQLLKQKYRYLDF